MSLTGLFSTQEDSLITVFGGAGYIGSHLTRLLLSEGFKVRVFDNFLFGSDGLNGLTSSPDLEVIEGDITDIKAASASIEGADAVVLLAAIVGHRIEDIHTTDNRTVNLLGSSALLDASLEHGVERFVFASTNSVYGVQSGVMYETTIPEPVSLYSRLKLRMEERVINARKRSFHPTALRIGSCYGYSPRMRFDLAANGLMRDAVCKGRIKMVSGEQYRPLVHVEDVARAFVTCLKAHTNLVSGETFNVGAQDQSVQLKQVVNIVKALVPTVQVTFEEGEPDLSNYKLSCSRIEKILDFTPRWTIQAGLEQLRDHLVEGTFSDPYSFKYRNT